MTPELQTALTMRGIIRAYGAALHVATTLQPPPVRLQEGSAGSQPQNRPSLLRRTVVRFVDWFG